jgi:hypothetical protein
MSNVHSYKGRWWRGEWTEEFWDSPCKVKLESKRREFKSEVKYKDGIGARWHGEWKKEFWDGPCGDAVCRKRLAWFAGRHTGCRAEYLAR